MEGVPTATQEAPAIVIAKLREENCDPQLFGVYDGYRDLLILKYSLKEATLVNFTIDELRTIRMPQYRHLLIRYDNIPITNIHFGAVVRKCMDVSLDELTAELTPELCKKIYVDSETKILPPILIYVPDWTESGAHQEQVQAPIEPGVLAALLENSPIVAFTASFVNASRFVVKTNFKKSLPQVSDTPGARPDPASGEQIAALIPSKDHVGYLARWLVDRCPAIPKQRQTEKMGEVQAFLTQVLKKRNTHKLILNTRKFDDYVYDELYKLLWTSRKRPQPLKLEVPNSSQRQLRRVVEIVTTIEKAAGSSSLRSITEANLKDGRYNFQFRPSNVLDIGCSDGYILEALGKVYGLETKDTVGMDIRPATSKEITFTERSALDSDAFPPETFDLITISMTLHHIPRWKSVLRNASTWLKPDGYIFIREHDATTNMDRLLLDIHDGAFNGSIWENPEQSWESFVAFAKSYFFGYATLCISAMMAGLTLSSHQWDISDVTNWKTHGMIYTAAFQRSAKLLLPPNFNMFQEPEKYAIMCTDIVFSVLDPVTHPDVLEDGVFTVVADEKSDIASTIPLISVAVAPNLKCMPFKPNAPLSTNTLILLVEAATAKDYEGIFKYDASTWPNYVCLYRTREKNDMHKGASLAIERKLAEYGYKFIPDGRVCYTDFAVICFSKSAGESKSQLRVMKY